MTGLWFDSSRCLGVRAPLRRTHASIVSRRGAMTERTRSLVAQAGKRADVVGDLGTYRLGGLPGLASLRGIVALAEDPLDLGISDLDAADEPAVAREAKVDRRFELDDPRPQLVGQLVREHQGMEEVELPAGLAVSSGERHCQRAFD